MAITGRGSWPLPTAWATWIKGRRYALRRQIAFGDVDDAEKTVWSDYFFATPTSPLRVLVADNASYGTVYVDIRLSKRTPAPNTATSDVVIRKLLHTSLGHSSIRNGLQAMQHTPGLSGVLASAFEYEAFTGSYYIQARTGSFAAQGLDSRLSKRLWAPSTATSDALIRKWLHTPIAHSAIRNQLYMISKQQSLAGDLAAAFEFETFAGAYLLNALQPARVELSSSGARISKTTTANNTLTSDAIVAKLLHSGFGHSSIRNGLQGRSKTPGLTGRLASSFEFEAFTGDYYFQAKTSVTGLIAPSARLSKRCFVANENIDDSAIASRMASAISWGSKWKDRIYLAKSPGLAGFITSRFIFQYYNPNRVMSVTTLALTVNGASANVRKNYDALPAEAAAFEVQTFDVALPWTPRALRVTASTSGFILTGVDNLVYRPGMLLTTESVVFNATFNESALSFNLFYIVFSSSAVSLGANRYYFGTLEWSAYYNRFQYGAQASNAGTDQVYTCSSGLSWDTITVYNDGVDRRQRVYTTSSNGWWSINTTGNSTDASTSGNVKLDGTAGSIWYKDVIFDMKHNGVTGVAVGWYNTGSAQYPCAYRINTAYDSNYWQSASLPGGAYVSVRIGPGNLFYFADYATGTTLYVSTTTAATATSSYELGGSVKGLATNASKIVVSGIQNGQPVVWVGTSADAMVAIAAPDYGGVAVNNNFIFITGQTTGYIWASANSGGNWTRGPAVDYNCYVCACDPVRDLMAVGSVSTTAYAQRTTARLAYKMLTVSLELSLTVTPADLTYVIQERRDLTLFADSSALICTGIYTLVYGLPRVFIAEPQAYSISGKDLVFSLTHIKFTAQTASGYAVDVTYFGTLYWDTYYSRFIYGAQANTAGTAQVFTCASGVSWDSWSVYNNGVDSRHRIRCQAGSRWWSINCTGASTDSTYWNSGTQLTRLDGTAGSIGYRDFMFDMKHNGVVGLATGWYNTGDVQYPVSYRINTGYDEYYWSSGNHPGGGYVRIAVGPGNLFYLADVATGTDLYESTTTAATAFNTQALGGSVEGIAADSSKVVISGVYESVPVVWVGSSAATLIRRTAPTYGPIATNLNFIFIAGADGYVWASYDDGQKWFRGPAHQGCSACAVDPIRDLMIIGTYSDATHVYPRAQRVTATIAYRIVAAPVDYTFFQASASIIGGPAIRAVVGTLTLTTGSAGLARVYAPFYIGNTDYPFTGNPSTLRRAWTLVAGTGNFVRQGSACAVTKTNALAAYPATFSTSLKTATPRAARKTSLVTTTFAATLQSAVSIRITASHMGISVGNHALQGSVTALRVSRTLVATQGAVSVTALSGSLRTTRRLAIAATGYTQNTPDASVRRTKTVISVSTATVALSVSNSLLIKTLPIVAAGGSFAANGVSANLRSTRRIVATTGTVYFSTTPATAAVLIPCTGTGFSCSVSNATLRTSRVIRGAYGTLTCTGIASSIRKTHTVFPTSSGAYTAAGVSGNLRMGHCLIAQVQSFVVTPGSIGLWGHWVSHPGLLGVDAIYLAASLRITRRAAVVAASFAQQAASAGIIARRRILADVRTYECFGQITFRATRALAPVTRTYLASGQSTIFLGAHRIGTTTSAYACVLQPAALRKGPILHAAPGVIMQQNRSAFIFKSLYLITTTGMFSEHGMATIVPGSRVLRTQAETFLTSESSVSLPVTRRITATRASFTRYALGVTRIRAGRRIPAEGAAVVLLVGASTLRHGYVLQAQLYQGSVQGASIGILGVFIFHDYKFPVSPGTFVADFTGTPVKVHRSLVTSSSTYSVSTQEVSIRAAIEAATLAYSVSGSAAVLTRTRAVRAESASIPLTTAAAGLFAHRGFVAVRAEYVVVPVDVAADSRHRLAVSVGVFTISTSPATPLGTYRLPAECLAVVLSTTPAIIHRTNTYIFSERFDFVLCQERLIFYCGHQDRIEFECSQTRFEFYMNPSDRFVFYIGNETRLELLRK